MVVGQVVISMQIILKKKVYTDQDKTFNVDEGSVYIENYNETLDSATIRISHITEPLSLEPFDKVILHNENNRISDKYMCIDTYTETMESLDPITYSYEISLFSETKELENILLPNLSITRLTTVTPRKVWYYLKQYLDLYDEKIKRNTTISKTYERKIYVAQSMQILNIGSAELIGFVKRDNIVVTNVTYTVTGGNIDESSISINYGDTSTTIGFTYGAGGGDGNIKVTISYTETNVYVNKHEFYNTVRQKFENIDCPEMQWNAPTLREVLTDLMMVADCIPVVRNNKIDFIDLTRKYRNISENTHINYIQRSQSAEDYVSELKMDLKNTMSEQNNTNIKSTVTTDWMTFRADSNGYLVDDKNICLYTRFPILKVRHLWMYFAAGRRYGSEVAPHYYFKIYNVDLCDFVHGSTHVRILYEKSEYDVLPIERWADEDDDFEEGITQNKAIYYERGNNIISGFNTATKKAYTWSANTNTIQWLKKIIAKYDDGGSLNDQYKEPLVKDNQFYSTYFKIEYETLADCVFTAGKDLPTSHNRVIADNQTNSYVNTYAQGFIEYQKANRLGNQQLFINARYDKNTNDALIQIGDYYNDSVVYQTQYKIYENHIDINAIATKDYILRDYFTGVKARVRSWTIASGAEALTRHELDKYYLEFDTRRRTDYFSLNYTISYHFLEYFINTSITSYERTFNYCSVKTESSYSSFPDVSGYSYVTDLVARIVGNSLVFTFGAEDNFEFGKRNKKDIRDTDLAEDTGDFMPRYVKPSYTDDYGGFPLSPLRYVDGEGNCTTISWVFSRNIMADMSSGNEDVTAQFLLETFERPLVIDSRIEDINFFQYKNIYKDNREILQMSVQFEVCSRTRNIVFTKKFLELQPYIRNYDSYPLPSPVYRLFYKTTDDYNFRDTKVPLDATEVTIDSNHQIDVTSLNNLSARLTMPVISGASTRTTYYITDSDKNTILMVRGTRTIYLNALKSRDINIYDEDREPVGTI